MSLRAFGSLEALNIGHGQDRNTEAVAEINEISSLLRAFVAHHAVKFLSNLAVITDHFVTVCHTADRYAIQTDEACHHIFCKSGANLQEVIAVCYIGK